jgi:hypothetical protein
VKFPPVETMSVLFRINFFVTCLGNWDAIFPAFGRIIADTEDILRTNIPTIKIAAIFLIYIPPIYFYRIKYLVFTYKFYPYFY